MHVSWLMLIHALRIMFLKVVLLKWEVMKFQLNYVLLRTVLNSELQRAIAGFVMLHICSCFSERKQKKGGRRLLRCRNLSTSSIIPETLKSSLHQSLDFQILCACLCWVWSLTWAVEGAYVLRHQKRKQLKPKWTWFWAQCWTGEQPIPVSSTRVISSNSCFVTECSVITFKLLSVSRAASFYKSQEGVLEQKHLSHSQNIASDRLALGELCGFFPPEQESFLKNYKQLWHWLDSNSMLDVA